MRPLAALVDLGSHTLDRLQPSGPVNIVLLGVATNPAGTSVTASPWLYTVEVAGQSGHRGDSAVNDNEVRPYSPAPVRATTPPSCSAMSWAP